jgi:hypothetical protein
VGTAAEKIEMNKIIYIASLLLTTLGPGMAMAAEGHYSKAMFARAVKSDSSRYALVPVANGQANGVVCVRGDAVVEAVAIEKGWTYGTNGMGKASGFAVKHWNRPFVFENPNAVAKVRARYTAQQLAEVRAAFARFKNAQLRAQLRTASRRRNAEQATEVQQLYAGHNTPIAFANREAVAHALLERGISVAKDERTGHLRLP